MTSPTSSTRIPEFKLVMFATSTIAEYATLSAEINRRYCARRGYAFSFEQYDDLYLHPSFEKVRVLRRHWGSARYLLWIDADACVINFSQSLRDFCDNGNDFVIAGHRFGFDSDGERHAYQIGGVPCGVNGGVIMFRSSEWSRHFLDVWWQGCLVAAASGSAFLEQGVLQRLLLQNVLDVQSHTNLVVPSSKFNRCDDLERDVCEFILHLWGSSAEERRRAFSRILDGQPPNVDVTLPHFDVR